MFPSSQWSCKLGDVRVVWRKLYIYAFPALHLSLFINPGSVLSPPDAHLCWPNILSDTEMASLRLIFRSMYAVHCCLWKVRTDQNWLLLSVICSRECFPDGTCFEMREHANGWWRETVEITLPLLACEQQAAGHSMVWAAAQRQSDHCTQHTDLTLGEVVNDKILSIYK